MKRIQLFLERISTGLVYVAACSLVLVFLFVCLSAIMRYLVKAPFDFTEELVGLLFLLTVFLSLPYACAQGLNLGVTLGISRLTGAWLKLFTGFNLVVMIVFAAWLAVLGYEHALFAYEIKASSEQIRFLLWPWMAVVPFVTFLIAAIAFVQLLQLIIHGEIPRTNTDEQVV